MIPGAANYRLRHIGLVVIIYVLVTWFTNPWTMGDTVDYADSVLAYHNGYQLNFWEFGHLLWRPFGWLMFRLFNPLTSLIYGADPRANITFILFAINWVSGLICLLVLRVLTERVCDRQWIVTLAPIGLLFSSAFLNYGQTGSAYAPGLALVLSGGLLLLKANEKTAGMREMLAAAALVAAGIALWIPMILIVPAVLAFPFCLGTWNRRTVWTVGLTLVLIGCFVGVAYVTVILNLGITNVHDLKEWVTSASHGMNRMRGIPRMIFGFANSLLDLGGQGTFFKRYLKHDPFNPVSLSELIWSSLWKLAYAYLFLLCIFINLVRSKRGKMIAVLVLLDLIPTIIFALFIFEAGDMSRYIATLPLIFLAATYVLCADGTVKWTKPLIAGFLLVSIVADVGAMNMPTLRRREQKVESRISSLLPLLKPESRVVTSHLQDEINNFTRDFLFNPINRAGNLHYYPMVAPNTAQVEHWRQTFAAEAFQIWNSNGDLWVSKRLLNPRPRVEWNWVEGDDPRVSWTDLFKYFSQFEWGQQVGGEDGFVLLVPSAQNRETLNRLAQNPEL
ncbi:MAG TPA: hypothetical protein VF075_13505 [Pyrinomonadaceae bacterium]